MQFARRHLFYILCQISFAVLYPTTTLAANDRLSQYQLFNDSSSLTSVGKKFRLGFLTPPNSNLRYLGIWPNEIPVQTVVWVANRNSPLNDASGILKIGNDGNLILENSQGKKAWSTNILNISTTATQAQLLDSGNLVLRYESDTKSDQTYLWQSFDHPSDTLLAGMKLGWDIRNGLNRNLTSWKSAEDPSPGEFSLAIDRGIFPQFYLKKGTRKIFRSGSYDLHILNGTSVRPNVFFKPKFISTPEEAYSEFDPNNEFSIVVLSYTGTIGFFIWDDKSLVWFDIRTHPGETCENYDSCGPNAICTSYTTQPCSCLTGYVPKAPEDSNMLVSSHGCIRKYPLNCPQNEGFLRMTGIKIPDTVHFNIYSNMNLDDCQKECLKNCSCTAYSTGDSSGGENGNCLLWYEDLFDLQRHDSFNRLTFHVRVTAEDIESSSHPKKKHLMMVTIPVSVTFPMLIGTLYLVWRKKLYSKVVGRKPEPRSSSMGELKSPTFDMISIAEATNQFSDSNKIGEGGFGPVYKGQIATGQNIAVKRLSLNSKQGLTEFKNEVSLISKLQHRNLVRLLGCCIHGEERMLIYEYMPNKSLHNYIYDCTTRKELTWMRRFYIIIGIARGLLYLHRDSRLRIIHRDVKASNILLDSEMNPKISDFGIARAFEEEQLLAKTTRVIGTHGYMAPEYVTNGLYSMKSDVFSFGVLLLEIISGRRNRDFYRPDHNLNLLGHAWNIWSEGKACHLIDELMEESFNIVEVERCIQVGLLCVQRCPEDRPTMSSVVLMLDSANMVLPHPKQPAGFYGERSMYDTEDPVEKRPTSDVTVTVLEGR
ncbi:G-type lectin S-receptor-like serine/threonine-protein kinase At4g27290 isoform X1 [Coffea arabica]|uniref:Receptor-like serine/threonine-protein kinase n=1 Tax=Coffea arabica TaxID=13443 RepID=A0ABM4WT44_COFAR